MEENNKGSKKIYMAIIIVLLLINGVAGYLLFNENKEKQTKIDEIAKLDTDFKSMNAEFETAKSELESLKGKNAELDAIIMERQATIEKYQAELATAQRKGNLSAAEIKRYKDLIAELQASNDSLQKKVAELTDKNQALTAQNLELDQNLNTEKQTTASLTADKENLSKKVALGSLLQLQNLKVEGIDKRNNGKEKTKSRLNSIDYLKISFATGENKVLEPGPLALYLRIINPKGETITAADQGSGTLKVADTGSEVQYSKKVDTEWNQSSKNLAIEWSQKLTDKGTYKVEVYQSGYLVGKGETELK